MTEPLTVRIEQTILDQMRIAEYSVVCRFCSRRNEVYRIHASRDDGSVLDFVYKVYIAGHIETEYHYLHQTQGVGTPKVLAKGKNALCLECIDGQLLIERLEEAEKTNEPFYPYLDMLIDFLARFYEALPGYVYGDINLRNFIIAQDGLYGIDLEETKHGNIAADIGRTAAYLLTYDPANTPYKKDIADYFINAGADRFSISKSEIMDNMRMELDYMRVRRQLRDERARPTALDKEA